MMYRFTYSRLTRSNFKLCDHLIIRCSGLATCAIVVGAEQTAQPIPVGTGSPPMIPSCRRLKTPCAYAGERTTSQTCRPDARKSSCGRQESTAGTAVQISAPASGQTTTSRCQSIGSSPAGDSRLRNRRRLPGTLFRPRSSSATRPRDKPAGRDVVLGSASRHWRRWHAQDVRQELLPSSDMSSVPARRSRFSLSPRSHRRHAILPPGQRVVPGACEDEPHTIAPAKLANVRHGPGSAPHSHHGFSGRQCTTSGRVYATTSSENLSSGRPCRSIAPAHMLCSER